MRSLLFLVFFIYAVTNCFSQADTIYTQKNQKISCKILEVNRFEIKYRITENPNDSVFVISKNLSVKFVLSNGYEEVIKADELSLENEHKDIIDKRAAIKINPFSPGFNHISAGFEKVLKVGMNLDIQMGFVNSTINSSYYSTLGVNNRAYHVGAYVKPGIKLFLGNDFYIRGSKYAHPLKGRYVRFDLAFSYLNLQDIKGYIYDPNSFQSIPSTTLITSNLNSISYGVFVNYGRQYILANVITIEYFFGAGFSGQTERYVNPLYELAFDGGNGRGFSTDGHENTNYYGFVRIPRIGELGKPKLALSGTVGLRIGYIIPSKKTYGIKNSE